MLQPDVVATAQRDLLAAVREPMPTSPVAAETAQAAGGTVQRASGGENTAGGGTWQQQQQSTGTGQSAPGEGSEEHLDAAIEWVTRDAVQLIDTWSGYLRERFADDAKDAHKAQQLVALQAGHAMGDLCWNLTWQALPLEKPVQSEKLREAWKAALAARDVSYLQHMLAVLAADGSTGSLDPKTMNSVSRSLDVWERTVRWLCAPDRKDGPPRDTAFDEDLRAALIEQASIWQALVQGERDLSAFTQPGVTQRLYVDAANTLAKTVNPQQLASLEHAVVDQAHAVLDPLITDISTTMTQITTGLTKPLAATWREVLKDLWPVLLIALIALLGLGGLAITLAASNNLPASITSFVGAAIVGGLGFLHLSNTSQQQQAGAQKIIEQVEANAETAQKKIAPLVEQKAAELQTQVNNIGQQATKTLGGIEKAIGETPAQLVHTAVDSVKDTVHKAVTQVLSDLEELEGVLAISYPLIDYIAAKTPARPSDGTAAPMSPAYDFLTTVVWNEDDQHQELLQVANAAFGPAGVFAVAATFDKRDGSGTTSASATTTTSKTTTTS
jgi:hypothetical protein